MTNPDHPHDINLMRGAFISPLVVPLLAGIFFGVQALFIEGLGLFGLFQMPILFLLFGLPFTYAVTFVLVLPMAAFLRRRNTLSAERLCLWCTLIASPALEAYVSLLDGGYKPMHDLFWLIASLLGGLVSGITFCRIADVPRQSVTGRQ